MAWFTNNINQELMEKKGLNIRVLISDQEANNKLLPKLKEKFDTVLVQHFDYYGNNRMHDKYRIIDMDYVMHGSDNWTSTAKYNGETLATTIDREFVKKFADGFMKIYEDMGLPYHLRTVELYCA